MNDNPYQPPQTPGPLSEMPLPQPASATREMLGLTREDLWAYLAAALTLAAWFAKDRPVVIGLFALAAVVLIVYLVKSMHKVLPSGPYGPKLRAYGWINNIGAVVTFFVVIYFKLKWLPPAS